MNELISQSWNISRYDNHKIDLGYLNKHVNIKNIYPKQLYINWQRDGGNMQELKNIIQKLGDALNNPQVRATL